MNSRQKEVLQSQLKSEEKVLKDLKQVYKKALDDINDNLARLLGRKDANLQHVIYQAEYQKALKKQVTAILDELNTKQFSSISEYLSSSYEDGFMGVLYDLHGQGIPLVFPINQDEIVRAIQHDTKLSKPLYDSLGEDMKILNRRIQSNISRGISQNSTYADIAANIARGMVGDYSRMRGGALGKAYTIARTESHRITSEARQDAQRKAKENGADVVKQWDAALDKRTRPHHARLDGQIREVEEPFEVDGHKALYPGGFGIAKEDINCRCAVLQRAKWALDDDELQTLKDRAEYYGLDKTESFEDFKKKYLETTNESTRIAEGSDITKTYKFNKSTSEYDFEIEDVIHAQGFDGLPRTMASTEFERYASETEQPMLFRTFGAETTEQLKTYDDMLLNGKWYVDCRTGGAQYGQGMYCAGVYPNAGYTTQDALDEMKDYIKLNVEKGCTANAIKEMTLDNSAKIIKFEDLREDASRISSDKIITRLKSSKLSYYSDDLERDITFDYNELSEKDRGIIGKICELKYKKRVHVSSFDEDVEIGKSIKTLVESADSKLVKRFESIIYDEVLTDTTNVGSYAVQLGYDAINSVGHGKSGSYTVVLNRTKLIIKE